MLPDTVTRRLSSIPDLSRQGKRINGLFRLLESPDLWGRAYEEIASNKGALTKGATDNTLDGFSPERVASIVARLKKGLYRFTPVRRVHIPKASGKMRPLGIPTADDKLVQSAVKLLLELVYEPIFSDRSHGFRRGRSCHTALTEVRDVWTGVKWLIDVDVVGFFDNIDHDILLKLLARKIDDRRFLRLIRGMLDAGYLEGWTYHPTYSGTPQGGVVSPILANVYLHELDLFMEDLKASFDRGRYRRVDLRYAAIQRKLCHRRKKVDRLKSEDHADEIATVMREIRALEAEQKQTPSKDWLDPGFRRLLYCRYADDFLVGVIGSKVDAEDILGRIKTFLGQELTLAVSEEKSGITKASDGTCFLGYRVRTWRTNRSVRIRMRGRYVTKRAASDYVQLRAPIEKLARFVESKGYGNYHTLRSTHRGLMIHSSDAGIVMAYNAELRGLASYYKLSNLWNRDLGRVRQVWWFSLMRTLAGKHRTTVKRIAQRLREGDEHVVRYTVDGEVKRCKVFRLRHLDRRPVSRPEVDNHPKADWITARSDILDRLNARVCEACSATGVPMEVHHVRKLADMRRAPLLQQVEAARRRKRVVLCRSCHVALHAGTLPDVRSADMQARRAG